MFKAARLKLTAWYLVIIVIISISFSVAIYEVLTVELDRVERIQRLRQQNSFPIEFRQRFPRSIDLEIINETKNRLKLQLLFINLGILAFSSLAGYFLAGRTLRPIQVMLDEQNRFITDASHELRTPLTSLKTEIEVNLRDKKFSLKDSKKLLQSNLEEVNKLQYLSDSLIRLTRYQQGNGVSFERIDLKEIIRQSIDKVSRLAKSKNIIIKSNVDKTITIMADPLKLTELLVILLDNSIKYSDQNTKIDLTAQKLDSQVLIKVVDRGIGIEASEIPHLFDRFFRGDKSRSKKQTNGYGLGLSIAKQIIDTHHGSINVQSTPGYGTTFIIQLPAQKA